MDKKIIKYIKEKKYSELKNILSNLHSPDIAEILEKIDNNIYSIKIIKLLKKDIGADVFSHLSITAQKKIVCNLSDSDIIGLVEEMSTDDAVDFIEEMPGNFVEKILKNSTKKTRKNINKLLCYKDESAGAIMTTEFVDIKNTYCTREALERIRKIGHCVETINVVYVTDQKRKLKGVLSIKDIILAKNNQKITKLMDKNLLFATTKTSQAEIANIFKKYNILALPIVDEEKRLVGIITVDDILEVVEKKATNDIAKMAAVAPNTTPYLRTSIFKLFITRLPWLVLLLLSSTLTGLIISNNENLLSGHSFGIILTACIPMIMGTGGNAGGQSSATIIRGIALGEIKFKDTLKVLWKEFRVSFLMSLVLCFLCFFKLLFVDGIYSTENGYFISAVICLSMFLTIVISKLVGSFLPLLAKKLHLDPAVIANPFITTIIDVLSLLILCGLSLTLLA